MLFVGKPESLPTFRNAGFIRQRGSVNAAFRLDGRRTRWVNLSIKSVRIQVVKSARSCRRLALCLKIN
jgi:hypothetical protein